MATGPTPSAPERATSTTATPPTDAPAIAPSASRCSLLALPTELRAHILDILVVDGLWWTMSHQSWTVSIWLLASLDPQGKLSLHARKGRNHDWWRAGDPGHLPRDFVNVFLTCRQMYAEGLPVVYRRLDCKVSSAIARREWIRSQEMERRVRGGGAHRGIFSALEAAILRAASCPDSSEYGHFSLERLALMRRVSLDLSRESTENTGIVLELARVLNTTTAPTESSGYRDLVQDPGPRRYLNFGQGPRIGTLELSVDAEYQGPACDMLRERQTLLARSLGPKYRNPTGLRNRRYIHLHLVTPRLLDTKTAQQEEENFPAKKILEEIYDGADGGFEILGECQGGRLALELKHRPEGGVLSHSDVARMQRGVA
jgi:hypothetical protein